MSTKNDQRQKLALWKALIDQGETTRAAAKETGVTTTTLYTWSKSGLRLTSRMRNDAEEAAKAILTAREVDVAKRRQVEGAAKARAAKQKSQNGEVTADVLSRALDAIAELSDVNSLRKVKMAYESRVEYLKEEAVAEVDRRFDGLV